MQHELFLHVFRYEWVYALRRDFPHLDFSLNGGITSIEQARSVLDHHLEENSLVRSVMIGRAAYDRPWDILANADKLIFGAESNPAISRRQVLKDYAVIADSRIGTFGKDSKGKSHPSLRVLIKPVLNLFHGEMGCKKFKQQIDTHLKTASTVTELFEKSVVGIPPEVLDAPPRESQETEVFSTGGLPPPWPVRTGPDGAPSGIQLDEVVRATEMLA